MVHREINHVDLRVVLHTLQYVNITSGLCFISSLLAYLYSATFAVQTPGLDFLLQVSGFEGAPAARTSWASSV